MTRTQWLRDSASPFPAIEDKVFGYRLHDLDLAVNKVLAMAGRREPGDYYDVIKLHQSGQPLPTLGLGRAGERPGAHAGVDPGRGQSTLELSRERIPGRISRCRPAGYEKIPLEATREARDLFPKLPLDQVGYLYLDRKGTPCFPIPRASRKSGWCCMVRIVRGAWPVLAPTRPRKGAKFEAIAAAFRPSPWLPAFERVNYPRTRLLAAQLCALHRCSAPFDMRLVQQSACRTTHGVGKAVSSPPPGRR